jgi:hypothetical protein
MKKKLYVLLGSLIILGTIFLPVISARNDTDFIDDNQLVINDSQRLFIIGAISNISDEGFNVISFVGKTGIYISFGWKGLSAGPIREKYFRILSNTFKGYLEDNFIFGGAVEQTLSI